MGLEFGFRQHQLLQAYNLEQEQFQDESQLIQIIKDKNLNKIVSDVESLFLSNSQNLYGFTIKADKKLSSLTH